jgi:hypothetical protein
MQRVFSERLLAGLRARNREEKDRDDTFQDPDDRVDPDDSGPRLSVTLKQSLNDETYALPATQTELTWVRSPYSGEINRARIASYSASRDGRRSCTPRFTRSRGTRDHAAKSRSLYDVRGSRSAAVGSGDRKAAGRSSALGTAFARKRGTAAGERRALQHRNDVFVRRLGLDRRKIIGHDSQELEIWVNRDDRAKFQGDLRREGSLRRSW